MAHVISFCFLGGTPEIREGIIRPRSEMKGFRLLGSL